MSKRNKPPSHYDFKIQVWDVIYDWGLCFWLGNVVKYVCRAGIKQGESELSDLKKARDYLNERIAQIEDKEAV